MASKTFFERMKGAALLDSMTYEEVEADVSATGQAAMVVVFAAVASGVGGSGDGTAGMIGGSLGALLGWLLWAGITYLVGTMLFNGTATWGELLRTLGFAQAPKVLLALAFLPMGRLLEAAVGIWVLVAGVIAIRQALDFDTGKAILTALVGWAALMVVGTGAYLITILGALGLSFG